MAYDEEAVLERHAPQHPEDANDKQAADDVRSAIGELHNRVLAATRRGLKVDLKLSGLGYANFDPCSTASVTITRQRII